jgi:hypothetical protein
MDRKIDKLSDETILEAKRFLNIHKPPAEMTAIERLRVKARHLREWALKEMGCIPKDAILVNPSEELARKARLSQRRDVPWPSDMQIR